MTSPCIIFINQEFLKDSTSEIVKILPSYLDYDWNNFISSVQVEHIHIRSGINYSPFSNKIVDMLALRPPKYNPDFNLSFAEVTDQHLHESWKKYSDKKWLILWSGGTDSTVILASVLKNLSKEDLTKIDVACNRISVYENPQFFYNHIVPNFNLIDSTYFRLNHDTFDQYYVFTGDMAETPVATLGGRATQLNIDRKTLLADWRNNADLVISFLQARGKDNYVSKRSDATAQWFYENIKNNINSVDVPIETCYDFFWWSWFNNTWVDVKLRSLHYQPYQTKESIIKYLDNFIPWFGTENYQHWAMNNNKIGVKYGDRFSDRKLALKQYIYDFNKDYHYFKYKTPLDSTGRGTIRQENKFFCLLDDFTPLYLKTNMSRIRQLLPTYINNNL